AAHVRRANELGLFRMAWSTDDCARDEAIVRAAGSQPFAPTGSLSVGDDLPRLQVLFWPGPSGECLELIEVTTRSGVLDAWSDPRRSGKDCVHPQREELHHERARRRDSGGSDTARRARADDRRRARVVRPLQGPVPSVRQLRGWRWLRG